MLPPDLAGQTADKQNQKNRRVHGIMQRAVVVTHVYFFLIHSLRDCWFDSWHRRQEPFCVNHKTYAKLSVFVKYVIKFVDRANPITNFEFAEEYAKNNKQNTYLIFIFLPYPIPNLNYVSHTRFNCVVITKPFRYLNYEEDYVSTAYLTTYLDFVPHSQ
jgi:hypothetical protein